VRLAQRILITSLAFVVGIALMPLAPVLMAWLFWSEADDGGGRQVKGRDGARPARPMNSRAQLGHQS
jgi:hypothetical protein